MGRTNTVDNPVVQRTKRLKLLSPLHRHGVCHNKEQPQPHAAKPADDLHQLLVLVASDERGALRAELLGGADGAGVCEHEGLAEEVEGVACEDQELSKLSVRPDFVIGAVEPLAIQDTLFFHRVHLIPEGAEGGGRGGGEEGVSMATTL